MRTALWALAGTAWFFVTWFVTYRLTFPSDAIVDRARFEVGRGSGGKMALDVAKVTPWRLGVSGRDVKLLSIDGGEATEFLVMDRARFRVAPFSVLSEPHVVGDLRFGTGDVDLELDLVPVDKRWVPRTVSLEAESFPLGSLPRVAGTKIEGTGALNFDLDLDAPEGFESASGSARLTGRTLVVTGLGTWGELLTSMKALPIAIDEIDLRLEITEGKARVVRGVLFSSLANVDLSGDITLESTLGRSRMRLAAVVEFAETGPLGALLGAPWSDGKHHYAITGTLQRPRASAESERSARRVAPATEEQTTAAPEPAGSPETLEAARAARERRLERLRDRPKPSPADPGGAVRAGVPVAPDDAAPVEEIEGDEAIPEGEDEPLDDELPIEEEAPIEEL